MKIYKKLGIVIGLSSLIFVFMVLALPKLATRSAAAAGPYTATDINNATFDFQDRATIIGHFGSDTIIFTDKTPTASGPTGTAQFEPPSGTFCNANNGQYLLVQLSNLASSKAANPPNAINATIHLNAGNSANSCAQVQPIRTVAVQSAANAFALATWDNEDLLTVDGKTLHSTCPATTPNCPTSDEFLENPNQKCSGLMAITTGPNSVTIYHLTTATTHGGGRGIPPAQNLTAKDIGGNFLTYAPGCYVDAINYQDVHRGMANQAAIEHQQVPIAGSVGTAAGGSAGGSADAPSTCETNSGGWAFTWLACPFLAAADSLTKTLYTLFEDQLSFSIGQLGSGGQSQVQQSWALLRDLSTGMIVIVTLIMVLSQAVSFGPFDAYTVRKMLPKIVAAVILIQISWVGVSFVIEVVNAIASGIADLMYYPFHGSGNMDLFSLLSHAGLGDTTLRGFSWAAIPLSVVLVAAFLPAALMAALAAIMALITALIVLIFRKILIITLVIFAPLAILAWVLPGTERYWKMWRENLLKVLFMFPLVVAMIAAGRIFAYIVGAQGINSVANSGNVLSFIFVMVGFFGPLFILPKTFKWGGQFMSAAAGGIANATNKIGGKESGLGKGVHGYAERVQGKHAKAYDPNANLGKKTWQRIRSGYVIPTARNRRLAIAAGDKWGSERDDEGLALVKRKGEKAMTEGMTIIRRDENGNMLGNEFRRNAAGEYLDAQGKVVEPESDAARIIVTDKALAAKKELKGVAAMKQMWVDLAETGTENEKKMAIRQLTATASWPELQGSFTSKGGVRVQDLDSGKTWGKSIATSPEDYPKVLRSRVDLAPHIIDGAEKELAAKAPNLKGQAAADFKSAHRMEFAISKQMSNEDFATQSDGFWQEAARLASKTEKNAAGEEVYTEQALKIQKALQNRFAAIQSIPGTAPQQMLGHLVGGTVQEPVEIALNGRKGGPIKVSEYIDNRSGVTPPDGSAIIIDHTTPPTGPATPGAPPTDPGGPIGPPAPPGTPTV